MARGTEMRIGNSWLVKVVLVVLAVAYALDYLQHPYTEAVFR